jgi:hypothetical protein
LKYIFYQKMPEKKVIIVLPVVGKPYVASDKDPNKLNDLQEIVGGYVETVNSKNLYIHPLFLSEEPRWLAVEQLRLKLKLSQYEIYVNENGIHTECPNMACVYVNHYEKKSRPLFGIIGIVTKENHLEGIDLPYKKFLEEEEESEEED